jgi:hypothetical protein
MLQVLILYVLCLLMLVSNHFWLLLYIYIFVVLCAIKLVASNNDLFAAFLLLLELTIVFIMLIFIFYINTLLTSSVFNYKLMNYTNAIACLFVLFYDFFIILPEGFYDFYFLVTLQNYYDWLNFSSINDLLSLFLQYYYLNSYILITFGYFLLIASVLCINIFKKIHTTKLQQNSQFFLKLKSLFWLFKFIFFKKQSVLSQVNKKSVIRLYSKLNGI